MAVAGQEHAAGGRRTDLRVPTDRALLLQHPGMLWVRAEPVFSPST